MSRLVRFRSFMFVHQVWQRLGALVLLGVFVFMIYATPVNDVAWVTTAKDVVHISVWAVGAYTLARLFFRWVAELQEERND